LFFEFSLFTFDFISVHPALVAAVFYLLPNLLPFFSPGKRSVANNANFRRQFIFFDSAHGAL
jgi:hypothetical protein